MIGIDFSAFVRMILLSLLLGACLGGVLEIIRFVFGICLPKTDGDVSQSSWLIQCAVAARDVIFFFISGIAFSVFVYYTNCGNVRFFAVLGTIAGFGVFYFTVGRFVRRALGFLINIMHKLTCAFVYPIKRMLQKCLMWIKSKKHITDPQKNNVNM